MNERDTTNAKKQIKFAVVFEMNSEKSNMEPGMHASAPYFIAVNSLLSVFRYHLRIMSAIGSSKLAGKEFEPGLLTPGEASKSVD